MEKRELKNAKEILDEMQKLVDAARTENRSLTEEEITQYRSLESELHRVQMTDDILEKFEKTQKAAKAPQQVQTRDYAVEQKVTTEQREFRNLGEQIRAIVKTLTGEIDSRLFEVRAASGMGEGSGNIGGYLLQTQFVEGILTKIYNQGQIISRCRRFQVGSGANTVRINVTADTTLENGVTFGGITTHWLTEGTQKTPSAPTIGKIDLTLNKLASVVRVTDELLEDAQFLTSWLDGVLTQAMIYGVENAIINGGGATSNQPLGILNASAPTVTVDPESGQSDNTIVLENIQKMWAALYPPSQQNAVWLVSPTAYAALLDITFTGFPLLVPMMYSTNGNNIVMSIFGRPLIVTMYQPSVGNSGDIILADFSQYGIAEKSPMQFALSAHARFEYDETSVRMVYRVTGAPLWTSTLTLSDGTTVVAPFVKVDDRVS